LGWVVSKLAKTPHKFWLVLKTKQASSSDAVQNVAQQDFEYFHPQFRMRAVNGVRRIVPLFPYYLMVHVNERKQDWKVLSYTRGVDHILMNCGNPSRVRNAVVEELRTLVDGTEDGYYHDQEHEPPRFAHGESVYGLRGLFKDKYGEYRGLAGNNATRVRVLFNILGREAEFQVRADDLRAVAA
jgi:transcription antitermination factor NusG